MLLKRLTATPLQEVMPRVCPCLSPRTRESHRERADLGLLAYPLLREPLGTLIFLPFSHPGKQAQKAATFQASGRPITDFDTSFIEPLLASASDDGRISISSLPSEGSLLSSSSLSLPSIAGFNAPSQKAVEIVKFHPTTSGLLLTNQSSDIQVWDFSNGGEAKAMYTLKGPQKGHWSVSWSQDGRLIQTAGKDNILSLWDVRQSTGKSIAVSIITSRSAKRDSTKLKS